MNASGGNAIAAASRGVGGSSGSITTMPLAVSSSSSATTTFVTTTTANRSNSPNSNTNPNTIAVPTFSTHPSRPITSKPRGVCKYYSTRRGCRHGERCKFLHGEGERMSPYDRGKVCRYFVAGYCHRKESCWFRHVRPDENAASATQGTEVGTADDVESVDEDDACCICREKPKVYGLLEGCSHICCLRCICDWRATKGKSEEMVQSGVLKQCPYCRARSNFVTPSSVFYPLADPRRAEVVRRYRERCAGVPCRHYENSGKKNCPFGRECLFKHTKEDGTPHIFTHGVQRLRSPQRRFYPFHFLEPINLGTSSDTSMWSDDDGESASGNEEDANENENENGYVSVSESDDSVEFTFGSLTRGGLGGLDFYTWLQRHAENGAMGSWGRRLSDAILDRADGHPRGGVRAETGGEDPTQTQDRDESEEGAVRDGARGGDRGERGAENEGSVRSRSSSRSPSALHAEPNHTSADAQQSQHGRNSETADSQDQLASALTDVFLITGRGREARIDVADISARLNELVGGSAEDEASNVNRQASEDISRRQGSDEASHRPRSLCARESIDIRPASAPCSFASLGFAARTSSSSTRTRSMSRERTHVPIQDLTQDKEEEEEENDDFATPSRSGSTDASTLTVEEDERDSNEWESDSESGSDDDDDDTRSTAEILAHHPLAYFHERYIATGSTSELAIARSESLSSELHRRYATEGEGESGEDEDEDEDEDGDEDEDEEDEDEDEEDEDAEEDDDSEAECTNDEADATVQVTGPTPAHPPSSLLAATATKSSSSSSSSNSVSPNLTAVEVSSSSSLSNPALDAVSVTESVETKIGAPKPAKRESLVAEVGSMGKVVLLPPSSALPLGATRQQGTKAQIAGATEEGASSEQKKLLKGNRSGDKTLKGKVDDECEKDDI